jgi:hypothetical protein
MGFQACSSATPSIKRVEGCMRWSKVRFDYPLLGPDIRPDDHES